MVITIGLAAYADYTVQTIQPWYNPQTSTLYSSQPYNPTYNQTYDQGYSQDYYQNPPQVQYQRQCINPYQYRRPYYGYSNTLPYAATGLLNTGGTQNVVRNIGQSMIYSMFRGY